MAATLLLQCRPSVRVGATWSVPGPPAALSPVVIDINGDNNLELVIGLHNPPKLQVWAALDWTASSNWKPAPRLTAETALSSSAALVRGRNPVSLEATRVGAAMVRTGVPEARAV